MLFHNFLHHFFSFPGFNVIKCIPIQVNLRFPHYETFVGLQFRGCLDGSSNGTGKWISIDLFPDLKSREKIVAQLPMPLLLISRFSYENLHLNLGDIRISAKSSIT